MKFYKLEDVPVGQDDQVFKISPVGKAIATLIFYGFAIAFLVLAIHGGKPWGVSAGTFYFVAAIIGLIGLLPLGMLRASLKPTSWVVRCNLSGTIIKYRAYENWKLPADTLQAVGIEYGEIAYAKIIKEHRITPNESSNRGNTTSFLTYLELGLVNPDTSELDAHLLAEQNLRPDGMMITMDYPVQVLPGGIVEVRWNDGVSPSVHKAVEILGRRVKILALEHRKVDLTHHRNADPEEERAKILALAKSGDEMGAVKLAQQIFRYSLTDAQDYVDKLMGRTEDDLSS